MAITYLASFPNSRIKPRSATRTREVTEVVIAADNAKTTVLSEDDNRTVATINNVGTVNLRYAYKGDVVEVDDKIRTEGYLMEPGDKIDIDVSEELIMQTDSAVAATTGLVSVDDGVG